MFKKIKLGNLELKNRFIRSATYEGLADRFGHILEKQYEIYERLSKGGVGLIIQGFTSVMDEDVYFDGIMRLSNDSVIPEYKRLVDLVHKEDVKVFTQLALGGYFKNNELIEPDYMSKEDIDIVINRFIDASKRAELIGYDGVQIHMAHFFFLSRFVSKAYNHRKDEYGNNRLLIVLKILKGIKESTNLHVSIKLNASDFVYGGNDINDAINFAKELEKAGIDSIEVSGNGTSVAGIKPYKNEAYFYPYAREIAEVVNVPVIVVGGFRTYKAIEDVINNSKIKFISLSRPLICEPDFINKLKENNGYVSKCVSCNACYRSYAHECVFRRNK